ncbi:MAG: STAS-like domain-containing protein [Rhizonema sp. NSF051]|nr:STAS-like domain-containing protein [Rhizonema sp. NSF051]
MKYKVYELIGENGMSQQAGQKIYNLIYPRLQAGESVELDFTGVRRLLSVFFNFAIGQLLGDIKAEDLNRLLIISNLSSIGQQTYDNVIENALHYYSDEQYRKAVNEMILEQSLCS